MSAYELAAVLRRRWYVFALVLLCTMAAVFAVHKRPITYVGCEGLYLSGGPPFGGNSYLDANPALAMVTGMVVQAVTSQPMQQRISTAGVDDYTVMQTNTGEIRFPAYTEPTLQICSTSGSPQAVLTATQLVTTDFRGVLHQMQVEQHANKNSFITATVLTPTVPDPVYGKPSLAYLGVLLIGIVSGIAITLWSDPLLTRSDRRRRAGKK